MIICVPTPLTKNREPDISFVIETGSDDRAASWRKGHWWCLESTTYPGTTDEDLRSILEEGSGMKAGVDFHLAFSRNERIRPMKKQSEPIPKVVGGYTPSLSRASNGAL